MPQIQTVQPGFQTTIQDIGRFGYAHLGISASGAADPLSLRIGNLLVGNPESAAALEMTLIGGEFEFEGPAVISITGSDFGPMLDGQGVPLWSAIPVKGGQRLKLGLTKTGARCYLCVGGGLEIPLTLGSSSTHILTRLGGFHGRALMKNDTLSVGLSQRPDFKPVRIDFSQFFARQEIRVTSGLQEHYFSENEIARMYSSDFQISEDSNRMGLRLSGPRLRHLRGHEIITEGAPLGAVQVPRNGELIILFVEHQTTGGYPKIANVISADIHRVGQLRPRDSVRFVRVTFEEASKLLREQQLFIESFKSVEA